MNIIFTPQAWEEYSEWQRTDQRTVRKINALIKEIIRDPFNGAGKPEALRHSLSGFWSRRIDSEHRVVYQIDDDGLTIYQCKYHY